MNINSSPFGAITDNLNSQIDDVSEILREVADSTLLPILGKHYDASGLKSHSGLLKQALTKQGARGNILNIADNKMSAGIDYDQIPGSKQAIEGRGAIKAKKGHSLRFYDDNGKPIFAKSVKSAPAHPVIFLSDAELETVKNAVTEKIIAKSSKDI